MFVEQNYAIDNDDHTVWWDQGKDIWIKIGQKARIVTWKDNDVYLVSEDDNSLWKWKHFTPDIWNKIADFCADVTCLSMKEVIIKST